MPAAETLYLEILEAGGLESSTATLPDLEPGDSCSVRLRCLPGASALHVAVSDRERVLLRAEVQAVGEEAVTIQLGVDGDGRVHLESSSRKVLYLPADTRFEPVPPIEPPAAGALDLALVIDGTSRLFEWDKEKRERRSTPLLSRKDLWEPHVQHLLSFSQTLVQPYDEARVAVVSFGDQKPPHAVATDLHPRYLLYPDRAEERALRPLRLDQLEQELHAIPATTGGDFVDALADALEACCELRWNPEARKLVVVFGDSPGHSVMNPVPLGGDACVREKDIDMEVMHLQEQGVEVMTLYLAPSKDLGLEEVGIGGELLRYARRQYRRLASLPERAFEASEFDPEEAAKLILDARGPVARGSALGELVELLVEE